MSMIILNLNETLRIIRYHPNLIPLCTNYSFPHRNNKNDNNKAMLILIYEDPRIQFPEIVTMIINNSSRKAFRTMCKEDKRN